MADEQHVLEENVEETAENEKKIRNTVLDTFRKLTHDKEKIVIKNGILLLKHLVENKEDEKGKSEIKYTLGRLIRGLGASKNSSKKGFYTVLSGLFHCVEDITITEILEFANRELHTSGGNSKSENADICAGQILLHGAIIQSGLFYKATGSEKSQIIDQLLAAGKKRNYLYLMSVTFILELCKNANENLFKSKVWPLVMPEVTKPWSEQNIDTVYLLYTLREKYSNIVNTKFMKQTLGTADVCATETLGELANILINIPRLDVANHPIYEIISKPLSNARFCVPFVNEADNLLIRLNYNRHIVVTLLLTSILQNLETYDILPKLLTKNYVQQTLQYFKTVKSSKNPEQLQEKIYQLFDVIVDVLKKDGVSSEIKIETLKRFIFYPGIFIFEKMTRSKIVQQITSVLDAEGVRMLAELYKGVILGQNGRIVKEEAQRWLNNDKIYAAQLLVKLFGHSAMHGELDWKNEQLKFLMELSLLKLDKYDHIGVELAASLKDTFFRALAVKMPKLDDIRNLLSSLVHHIDKLLTTESNSSILRNPLSDEAFETWTKSLTTIKTLESQKSQKNNLYPVFRTLFLHLSLQLFNDVKLAKDSLEELLNCYARIKKTKNDEELKWIEVVVDLFLNLLSHNSYLLRNMVSCVFPHLCKHLDATSVHQILDVLDPENENNPLMEDSDDSEDDEENDESSESELSEEEEVEEEDDEETVNDKLKDAVRSALGGYQTDEESVNLDDLSDSEGQKLDDALALAFKQFKPNVGKKSKKQKKEDEALTHFRIRALDLIDIYFDSEPSMFLCLEIMIPLLRLLEFSTKDAHQTPLLNRVRATLKKLSTIKKFSSLEDMTESVLPDLFASLLEKGEKNTLIVQEMGDKIADCCLFIIRCSQHLLNAEETTPKTKKHLKKKINKITSNALESFFTKRESLTPYVLFKNIFQMTSDANFELFRKISEYVFSDKIRPFRRTQALELAKIFFANHRLLSGEIPESFTETLHNFTRDSETLLKNAIENPETGKEKFIRNFFTVLSVIKQSPVKDLVDFSSLGDLVKTYRSMVNFTGETKKAYNKLCRALGVDGNVMLKDTLVKFSAADSEDVTPMVKGKKIKKDKVKGKKGNAKLKKETQQLRMESLSGGLKVDFGNVDVNAITNDDEDEDVDDSPSKKRKNEDEGILNGKKLKKTKDKRKINGHVNGDVNALTNGDESIEESPGKKRKNDGKTASKKIKKVRL